MASGGPGGGNEPPGRGTDAAKSWYGCPLVVYRWVSPWGALDYASCGAAADPHPRPLSQRERGEWWGGSDGAGPVIPIRRVAHSLRTAIGNSRLSPGIAPVSS